MIHQLILMILDSSMCICPKNVHVGCGMLWCSQDTHRSQTGSHVCHREASGFGLVAENRSMGKA